jgi:hypothetical protein
LKSQDIGTKMQIHGQNKLGKAGMSTENILTTPSFLYPILYIFLILNQVAEYNITDSLSVGYTGNPAEFREINPVWRIRGPILVRKTRRTEMYTTLRFAKWTSQR